MEVPEPKSYLKHNWPVPEQFLHERTDFADLIKIVTEKKGINNPALAEKDYWIMHSLYGLKKQGFLFELKGGTSLSKGYGLIHRFSEDIDIHIKPPARFGINENSKNCKPNNVKKRLKFYDWLSHEIKIPGIISVVRDTEFDDIRCYNSGGIRLRYKTLFDKTAGVKDGILLEAGFDVIAPNTPRLISSWLFDAAIGNEKVSIIDNRAQNISCYHSGYTLVEKLQTIVRKYRVEQETDDKSNNFMRQYYDVYCLLKSPEIVKFIGTDDYRKHKENRFSDKNALVPLRDNEAFLLSSPEVREDYIKRYKETSKLYYIGQPDFNELIGFISTFLDKL